MLTRGLHTVTLCAALACLPHLAQSQNQKIARHALAAMGYAQSSPAGGNLLSESGWALYTAEDKSAAAEMKTNGKVRSIHITKVGKNPWDVQLFQKSLSLRKGARYVLSFRIRASKPRAAVVTYQQDYAPYSIAGLQKELAVTTAWKPWAITFTAADCKAHHGSVPFLLGQHVGTVEIADVMLKPAH